MFTFKRIKIVAQYAIVLLVFGILIPAQADETCNSPYTTTLIKGREQFVHVWVLGVKGMGDGSDKLRGGPGRLDRGRVLLSEIFCLTILVREGAEDDQEKATKPYVGVQGEGGIGGPEGRAHLG